MVFCVFVMQVLEKGMISDRHMLAQGRFSLLSLNVEDYRDGPVSAEVPLYRKFDQVHIVFFQNHSDILLCSCVGIAERGYHADL